MKPTPPATYRPDPNTEKPNSTRRLPRTAPQSQHASDCCRPAIVRKTAGTITPAGRQAGNVSSHITPHHTNKRQMPDQTHHPAPAAIPETTEQSVALALDDAPPSVPAPAFAVPASQYLTTAGPAIPKGSAARPTDTGRISFASPDRGRRPESCGLRLQSQIDVCPQQHRLRLRLPKTGFRQSTLPSQLLRRTAARGLKSDIAQLVELRPFRFDTERLKRRHQPLRRHEGFGGSEKIQYQKLQMRDRAQDDRDRQISACFRRRTACFRAVQMP